MYMRIEARGAAEAFSPSEARARVCTHNAVRKSVGVCLGRMLLPL